MSQVPPPHNPPPHNPSPSSPAPHEPLPATSFGTNPLRPDATNSGHPEPSKRWIWVGAAIVVGGIAAAIFIGVFGVWRISGQIDSYARVGPPGGDVRLEAGRQVVFREGRVGGTVAVFDDSGREIRLAPYVTGLTYTSGSRTTTAVATIDVDEAGTYRVDTTSDVAIGPSFAGSLILTLLVPFAVGAIGIVVGGIVFIVALVRWSNARRRPSLS